MKIFVLGCSFSKYYWPTWVDILQKSNSDIEFLNFARPGIGNSRIFYRLTELLYKNFITDQDKIFIVWTSWHREDRLINNKWTEEGNIFNSKLYGEKFAKKYWSSDFDIIKNCNSIISANKITKISLNGSWLKLENTESYYGDKIFSGTNYSNLYDKYNFLTKNLPEFIRFDHSTNTFFNYKSDDKHPDVMCHYDYAKKVAKYAGLKIDNCEVWKFYQNKIEQNIKLELKREKLWNIISEITDFKPNFIDPIRLES